MKYIDLHLHTTFSDGLYTPEEIVALAAEQGLAAIAITDHDNFSAYPRAKAAGEKYGIKVLPGIEMSTSINGLRIDILNLLFDPENPCTGEILLTYDRVREERNKKMLSLLQKAGIVISLEALAKYKGDGILSRTHVSRYLAAQGYAKTPRDAFKTYLSPGAPGYVKEEEITAKSTVRDIKAWGGLSSLAHPLRYGLNQQQVEKMVKELASFGLNALEVKYPLHSKKDEEFLLRLCRTFKLLPTGGSDCHGGMAGQFPVGCANVPYAYLENLRNQASQGIIKNTPMPPPQL